MSSSEVTPARAREPRRQKSSKPSIYFREDSKRRRVYEYVYRDASGKQRWVSGFATIKDAEDARAEVLRRIRRGERVAPIKATFEEFAKQWLDSQSQLRDSTRDRYDWAIRVHLVPRFRRLKLGEITTDHVALLIADLSARYSASTIKSIINPLSLIMGRAVRRGAIAANPVLGLERSERPSGSRREMRILDRPEIGKLLDAAPEEHRPPLAVLVFCGLRISEALGLVWADVDLDAGRLHVRRQLDDKTRQRVEPKTPNAVRAVVLMPALVKLLAQHKLRSRYSTDTDAVFTTRRGTPLNRHNFRARIFLPAIKRAALDGDGLPSLRTHDLRHTFASMLVAQGASIVYVSRQMGHASPAMTLSTYSHLFDARDHADKMASMMEEQFGSQIQLAP